MRVSDLDVNKRKAMKHTIGILGGMGPAATADMLENCYPRHASCDQQHPAHCQPLSPIFPDRTQHACYPAGLRHTVICWSVTAYAGRRRGGSVRYPMQHCALLVYDDLQNVAKARMIKYPDAPPKILFPPSARALVCWRPMRRWRPVISKESAGAWG